MSSIIMQVFHTSISFQSRVLVKFVISNHAIVQVYLLDNSAADKCILSQKKNGTKITFSPKCWIYIFVLKTNKTQEIFRIIHLFIIKYILYWNLFFLFNFTTFCLLRKIFFSFLDVAERWVASVYLIDPLPVLGTYLNPH